MFNQCKCSYCGSSNVIDELSQENKKYCLDCGMYYYEDTIQMETIGFGLDKEEYLNNYEYYTIECNLDGWLRERR